MFDSCCLLTPSRCSYHIILRFIGGGQGAEVSLHRIVLPDGAKIGKNGL